MLSPSKPYVVPIFIPHAGCPHRCVFCDQKQITGNSALPTATQVRRAIGTFLKHCGDSERRTEISFYGGNFLGLPPERIRDFLEIATQFVTEKKVDGLRFSTRPDTITHRTLSLLKGFPVNTIELGVQSMCNRVLSASNRGHGAGETRNAVSMLKHTDYEIGLQMMTGLPADTHECALTTAHELIALKADFVRIYPALVLRGSDLATQYHNGQYQPMPLESCVTLVSELYTIFAHAGIPVVRMGLQSSESLDVGGAIIAGPYHPAFGHLVFSRLYLNAAIKTLTVMPATRHLGIIHVHPSEISRMQGIRNQNLEFLKKKYPLFTMRIAADHTLIKGHIRIGDQIRAIIARD